MQNDSPAIQVLRTTAPAADRDARPALRPLGCLDAPAGRRARHAGPTERDIDAPILETRPAHDRAAYRGLCSVIDRVLEGNPDDRALILAPDATLRDDRSARITLAWLEGQPVGCVATWLTPGPIHGWLGSLCCDRSARGRGLATALVDHAVRDRDAMETTPPLLLAAVRTLRSGEPNPASWAALRASGFIPGARIRPRIADLGERARHWLPVADVDGTVSEALLVRLGGWGSEGHQP